MTLSVRQIEVLRAAAAAPGPIERRPGWHGMTLRSLQTAGYIETGAEWSTLAWWGAHGQRVEEGRSVWRQLVRATPLGRERAAHPDCAGARAALKVV